VLAPFIIFPLTSATTQLFALIENLFLFAVLVFCASTDDVSNNKTAVKTEIILNMFCPNYMNS
jgi:hypothetical protein